MNISELAYVSLGSNLGDSIRNVREAIEELQSFSDEPMLKSSLWQSSPVDCPPNSPLFINAVAAFEPRAGETPLGLLERLQTLEKKFGPRPRKILNEPRPLDLDLITYGAHIIDSPQLTLPHPRAHLRKFVLQPLCEIAPELILAGQMKTAEEICDGLRTNEVLVKL